MTDSFFGMLPEVKINGSPLAQSVTTLLARVVVDTDVAAPDSCELEFHDPDRNIVKVAGIAVGATLSITAGRPGEAAQDDLFSGSIYSVGFRHDETGTMTTVTAYDAMFPLYHGQHTMAYRNLTDSDLVQQVAQSAGVPVGNVDSTSVVHDHIAQINESWFSLLDRRARRTGHQLRTRQGKLEFVRPSEAQDAPDDASYETTERAALVAGTSLRFLSARVTAATQVSDIEVRGWDARNRKVMTTVTPNATSSVLLKGTTPSSMASANGSPHHVSAWRAVSSQSECDALATAQAACIAASIVDIEAEGEGDPRLRAGVPITIGEAGGLLEGQFTLSRAQHVFSAHHGYVTRLWVCADGGRNFGWSRSALQERPLSGVVAAIVTNVSDPESLGRVRLSFPWLSDDYETDWVRVANLGAGADRGFLHMPEVNDEVLAAFEQEDPGRPVVIGSVYGGSATPPYAAGVDNASGTIIKRGMKSRKGHEVMITESDDEEAIVIRTNGTKVSLLLDGKTGDLTVETDGKVSITSDGDISVSSQQNLSFQAQGSAKIEAQAGLDLKSSGTVSVSGSLIKLN